MVEIMIGSACLFLWTAPWWVWALLVVWLLVLARLASTRDETVAEWCEVIVLLPPVIGGWTALLLFGGGN
jgi:hypothetical protein